MIQYGVTLKLIPVWKDGWVWKYKSTDTSDILEEVPVLPPTPVVVTPIPEKHHHTFQQNEQNGKKVQENSCCTCNEAATKPMWLECDHKDKLNGRKDCSHWVINGALSSIARKQTLWPRSHSSPQNMARKNKITKKSFFMEFGT